MFDIVFKRAFRGALLNGMNGAWIGKKEDIEGPVWAGKRNRRR